jgi:hypothetical protein
MAAGTEGARRNAIGRQSSPLFYAVGVERNRNNSVPRRFSLPTDAALPTRSMRFANCFFGERSCHFTLDST